MEEVAKNAIDILRYLLPGFLAAWVFYGFTAYPKPSQFERVIQALIFTLIIETFVTIEKYLLLWVGSLLPLAQWTDQSALVASTLSALIIGVSFSYFANNDRCHALARKLRITKQTSFPSEWFGAFLKNVTYIVLHLKDERRIYGWPMEWPSGPNKGHFVLRQVSWIDDKGANISLEGVESILINVLDVRWVEFMEKTWET